MSSSDKYDVTLTDSEGELVVWVCGEIDLVAEERLNQVLDQARRAGRRFVVDLSQTAFIDSSGLRALAQAWEAQNDAGLGIELRRPQRVLVRTFEVAGLAHLLQGT